MNWLKKYMIGRYGGDQLSIFLLILSMVITLISRILGGTILGYLSYLPFLIALYRMFSKDIQKRRMENYKFSILISPIYAKVKKAQNRIKASKTHKYYTCPKCRTALRVPKGKGKILITCPNCKEKFSKKA